MATLEELPHDVRTFVERYKWHRIDPVPWAEPQRALSESRVGLVALACMTMPDQPPFHAEQPGNDPSIRVIPAGTSPSMLVNTFPGQAFDHAGLAEDANLLVPIDRLREMVNLGAIAELSPRVISLCGDIVHPQRLIEETAPQVAQMFRDDRADAVLLVPACPTCNQTVSLVAAEIERAGIPTVCQIYLKEAAEKLRPPRALWVPFPHGYALGHPSDTVTQRDVLKQTFALLEDPGPPPVLKDYRPLAAAVPDSRKA